MNVSPTATFVGFVTAEKIADVVSTPKFEVEELETDLVVAGRDVPFRKANDLAVFSDRRTVGNG